MDKLEQFYELENIKPVHKIKKIPVHTASSARIDFDNANIKIYYDEMRNVWKKNKVIIGANDDSVKNNSFGIFQIPDDLFE